MLLTCNISFGVRGHSNLSSSYISQNLRDSCSTIRGIRSRSIWKIRHQLSHHHQENIQLRKYHRFWRKWETKHKNLTLIQKCFAKVYCREISQEMSQIITMNTKLITTCYRMILRNLIPRSVAMSGNLGDLKLRLNFQIQIYWVEICLTWFYRQRLSLSMIYEM